MTWIPKAEALLATASAFPALSIDERLFENWTRTAGECPPTKVKNRLGYESDALEAWHSRLRTSTVALTLEDYRRCMAFAVEAYYRGITHADFSRGKQRDAGEFITNQIQGKLGEIAVQRLLQRHGLEIELDFNVEGQVASQDITRISTRPRVWNNPALNVSIKATKLKNILLAVTESEVQMEDRRSDIYVLSQVGLFSDHLLRILKTNGDPALFGESFSQVPGFREIPARIAGWTTLARLTSGPPLQPSEIKSAFGVEMAKPNYVLSSRELSTNWDELRDSIVGRAALS